MRCRRFGVLEDTTLVEGMTTRHDLDADAVVVAVPDEPLKPRCAVGSQPSKAILGTGLTGRRDRLRCPRLTVGVG